MKKTIVKMFSLLLAITMLAVPVFAGGNLPNLPEEGEATTTAVQPRFQSCEYCESGSLYLFSVEYTEWKNIGIATDCEHDVPTVKDIIQGRYKTTTYRCDSCDMDEVIQEQETRIVHP